MKTGVIIFVLLTLGKMTFAQTQGVNANFYCKKKETPNQNQVVQINFLQSVVNPNETSEKLFLVEVTMSRDPYTYKYKTVMAVSSQISRFCSFTNYKAVLLDETAFEFSYLKNKADYATSDQCYGRETGAFIGKENSSQIQNGEYDCHYY